MATNAQRAPRVGARTGTLALPLAVMLPPITDEAFAGLQVFGAVPPGCDVVPIRSHVAVFLQEEIGSGGLAEGGIYVYENQRPVAPLADARRICTRKVVRVYRNTKPEITTDSWWVRDLDRPLRPGDGPYYDWGLANLLIGRVVGIYSPAAAQVAA